VVGIIFKATDTRHQCSSSSRHKAKANRLKCRACGVDVLVKVLEHYVDVVVSPRLLSEQRVDTPTSREPKLDLGRLKDFEHPQHVILSHFTTHRSSDRQE
jgi:hypothetical protein